MLGEAGGTDGASNFPLLKWPLTRAPSAEEAAERAGRQLRFKVFLAGALSAFFLLNFSTWWYLNATDIREQVGGVGGGGGSAR